MNLKDFGLYLADKIAEFIGSWTFIIIQSTILTIWVTLNVLRVWNFDPYPFILLNLFLSFEAAYATPLILMSANRTADRDREHMLKDLCIDEEDHIIIAELKLILNEIRRDIKMDKQLLEEHQIAKEDRARILEVLLRVEEQLKGKSRSRI